MRKQEELKINKMSRNLIQERAKRQAEDRIFMKEESKRQEQINRLAQNIERDLLHEEEIKQQLLNEIAEEKNKVISQPKGVNLSKISKCHRCGEPMQDLQVKRLVIGSKIHLVLYAKCTKCPMKIKHKENEPFIYAENFIYIPCVNENRQIPTGVLKMAETQIKAVI